MATFGMAALGVVAAGGCAAMQSTKEGIGSTQSAVSDTTGTVKGVEGQAKGVKTDVDEHAQMGKKGAKGGGGGSGAGDPDGDGKRAQAKEAKVNEAITDNLDPSKGDTADWRFFAVAGRPGRFTVELHWDDESAVLNLDVYDAFGSNIASAQGKPDAQALRAIASLDQPSRTYVKISSVKGATDYTFMAKWAGGTPSGGPSPVAANEGQNPAGAAAGGSPAPGAGGGAGPAAAGGAGSASPADPMHPRARIVQSYREGSDLVLYLDKGSAAQIKAGMSGFVLEGDTDKPLDGGTFRITKVVDATHSVAKASFAKVGKNTKCVINLVK